MYVYLNKKNFGSMGKELCVCVCEREREREGERKNERKRGSWP